MHFLIVLSKRPTLSERVCSMWAVVSGLEFANCYDYLHWFTDTTLVWISIFPPRPPHPSTLVEGRLGTSLGWGHFTHLGFAADIYISPSTPSTPTPFDPRGGNIDIPLVLVTVKQAANTVRKSMWAVVSGLEFANFYDYLHWFTDTTLVTVMV